MWPLIAMREPHSAANASIAMGRVRSNVRYDDDDMKITKRCKYSHRRNTKIFYA